MYIVKDFRTFMLNLFIVQKKAPLRHSPEKRFPLLFRLPCAAGVVPDFAPFSDENTQGRRSGNQRRYANPFYFVEDIMAHSL